MKNFKVEFEALERTGYSVCIEANSAKEALSKFNDPGFDRGEYFEEYFEGTEEKENNVRVTGRWILNKDNTESLKKFKKPVKASLSDES